MDAKEIKLTNLSDVVPGWDNHLRQIREGAAAAVELHHQNPGSFVESMKQGASAFVRLALQKPSQADAALIQLEAARKNVASARERLVEAQNRSAEQARVVARMDPGSSHLVLLGWWLLVFFFCSSASSVLAIVGVLAAGLNMFSDMEEGFVLVLALALATGPISTLSVVMAAWSKGWLRVGCWVVAILPGISTVLLTVGSTSASTQTGVVVLGIFLFPAIASVLIVYVFSVRFSLGWRTRRQYVNERDKLSRLRTAEAVIEVEKIAAESEEERVVDFLAEEEGRPARIERYAQLAETIAAVECLVLTGGRRTQSSP